MCSGCGVDELPGDAHAVRRLAHAAFEHIAHAELAADLLHVDRPALVGEGRIARDDEKPFDARKAGDDVLDHAVGEIFLFGIAAHVLEGQDCDRWLIGQRKRESFRRTAARLQLVDPHRPCDVLQLLFAHVLEVCVELAAHLPVGVVGYADAAGLSDTFEPRGNIDAVAEYVAVLDDDVADMDANAEFDALVLRHRRVTLDHAVLNFNGTARGVDGACELNQDTIAGPLDDAAAMIRDLRFQELAPMSIEPRQRAFLVGSHQAAVAGDVAGEDSG